MIFTEQMQNKLCSLFLFFNDICEKEDAETVVMFLVVESCSVKKKRKVSASFGFPNDLIKERQNRL